VARLPFFRFESLEKRTFTRRVAMRIRSTEHPEGFLFQTVAVLVVAALFLIAAPASGEDGTVPPGATAVKAAYASTPPGSLGAGSSPGQALAQITDAIVFTAPPRETPEEGQQIYGPITEYLSRVLNRKVIYRHPGTWGVYRTQMLKGEYDLVFDGPHFNGYRAQRLNHNVLVKIPTQHEFVVITRLTEPFKSPREMAGRTFCAHAPPNLGTLVLLDQFDNPARQPVLLNTNGWENIYAGVVNGRCAGGILPLANLEKFDWQGQVKIIYRSPSLPNQAFSAGPRLSPEEQARIAAALLAPQALEPTAKLRQTYKVGTHFVAASNEEYLGVAKYLRNEWGYY
jgi:ABC-type phosphate/phosphonate transport system substrate-binding protein